MARAESASTWPVPSADPEVSVELRASPNVAAVAARALDLLEDAHDEV